MYLCLFNIYANPENPGINDLQSRDFWDQILVRDPEIPYTYSTHLSGIRNFITGRISLLHSVG
jgi:hypothetical protein